MATDDYVVMQNICKAFGKVTANHGVNFSVKKGEIHALLGENGSGKSTLMNILAGIYAQDSGTITINGKYVDINCPKDAIDLGIGMVHQHFKQVDVFTAAENIIGGHSRSLFIKKNKNCQKIETLCARFGFNLDPRKMTYRMSVSEKQTVEIVKALFRGATVLILDEPTAVLTPQETTTLFETLRNMRDESCSIIIITHKLNEVMDISDRVTVLRKGESLCTLNTVETTPEQLTELMVGHAVNLHIPFRKINEDKKAVKLEIQNLTVKAPDGKIKLDNISFSIKSHEIFGIAGIAGSGQKELCEAIAGLQTADAGRILLEGKELISLNPSERLGKGISIGFIPEDRLGMGLAGGLTIEENIVLKSYQAQKSFFMDHRASRKAAELLIEEYQVSASNTKQTVRSLSGGNIQKVLLGREISQNPTLLIAAYPVRGLDIAASHFIYNELNKQKERGVAILLIGEDLDVLTSLCDRIGVLHEGRLMGIIDAKSRTKEEIGWMMLGQKAEEHHAKSC